MSILAVFEQLKVEPLMFYLVFGESVLNDGRWDGGWGQWREGGMVVILPISFPYDHIAYVYPHSRGNLLLPLLIAYTHTYTHTLTHAHTIIHKHTPYITYPHTAVALVLFNIFSKFIGAEFTAGSMGFALLDFLIIFIGKCGTCCGWVGGWV